MTGWLCRLADGARHRLRRGRMNAALAAGRRGEDIAHRYLERRGFVVVARNWRPRSGHGEIDVVAWEGATLVFVEVKSRSSAEFGSPERNVDGVKRQALFHAARDYARQAGAEWDSVRFDLVSVLLAEPPAVEHHRGAFPLA